MKNNGDIIKFIKQKDYNMVNNNLGSGAFGKTVLVKDPYINELFVVKKYDPYLEQVKKVFFENFIHEIKIMYKLNHPNVVRVFNYYPYETLYTGYIVMEYIDGKNIEEYLAEYTPFNKNNSPDNLFLQLIDGFDYIEKQGIVHRDIREGNILVTSEGIVKIIDFGLGKTFSAVGLKKDSMVNIINRSGLDRLPAEYNEGIYDSKTDMFYLAELFNRLLVKTGNYEFFSYRSILSKMMSINRNDRYNTFAEVKECISKKDFMNFEITEMDKTIYQNFSNAILSCLSCFLEERKFVETIDEFKNNLHSLIQKNCFEDVVQDTNDVVSLIVKGNYRYYTFREISCETLKKFEKWFLNLSDDVQRLVLNNIISKTSKVKLEINDGDLPF